MKVGQIFGADDEHDAMHAPEEEAQAQRNIHTLATPSAEEMADHCGNSRIPYCNWCFDCSETFGRESVLIEETPLYTNDLFRKFPVNTSSYQGRECFP